MKQKRSAYATFEETILNLYERQLLTLHLLDSIALQYCLEGIDSAGGQSIQTHDGKDLHQICISLVDPSFPIVERGASGDDDEYWEQELKKWDEIIEMRWS